ncbi:DG5 microsatellite sequence, partial [Biomphalaria glabrata]
TKSLIEEKENVVLMGAIVISIFTVIATLLSLTRATKCHCIKNSWTRLQARKRDRYSNGRNTRNNRSARSHPGETLTLMTVNVTNDNTTSSSLGVQTNQFPHCRSENGTEHGSSEVSVPGQENTDVASQSVMRSEATTSISLTTNESNDLQRTTESDTVNGQLSEVAHCPTMSALIGLLPPVYDPSTPMPSSLTLFTSLLPSRWRMHRSSSVFMTSATETPTRPACLTSITASGGEPMARSSTSRQSLSPQTDRAPYLQSSNTYHARSPTSAGSDSFPDSPPPYVDLSPPNYSTLFPSHT